MSSIYDISFPQANPEEPSYFLEEPAKAVEQLAPTFAGSSSNWTGGDFFTFLTGAAEFLGNLFAVL